MKIAIVRLSAMGDIINSAYILQFVKEKYPHATIDWFCEEAFAPILEDQPFIDTLHTVNIKKIKKLKSFSMLWALYKKLKNLEPYDTVIDLQGLVKSALVAKLLGKNRYGFAKDSIREAFASHFYKHKCSISYSENSIWRSAYLINFALDLNITKEAITHKKPSLYVHGDTDAIKHLLHHPAILFVVGSSQAYKNYPTDQIAKTIDLMNKKILLLWGSPSEYEDAKKIATLTSNAIIAPKLTLNELKLLVLHSDLVIGNDTGPTHLAWALNRPSITLFGATPASKMMWETTINVPLESSSAVNPLKLDKEDFSIREIDPQDIKQLAQRLLDANN